MKKKKIVISFLVVNLILFILSAIFWYDVTSELYQYDNFKEELINEIRENPQVFKETYNIVGEEQLTNEIIDDIYNKSKNVGRYIFIALAATPISLFGSIILFLPIILILSIIKKYRKYRLSIDEFKENNGYYRDLLKDYNPLELSYNNNYNIDDYALIAMTLYLEKKKVISIKDNKFSINNDEINNLSELEKKFIDNININNKNSATISHSNLTNLVDNSCKSKKLLGTGNISKRKLLFDIFKAVVCYIILIIVWNNINTILNLLPSVDNTFLVFSIFGILILMLLFVIFYPFAIITKYLLLYIAISIEHSKRTDLGNEINYKLDGLKNFIRDFSSLDERTKEEIVIWDDYLIYSVLFGDNKNVYDEMKDIIKYTY